MTFRICYNFVNDVAERPTGGWAKSLKNKNSLELHHQKC